MLAILIFIAAIIFITDAKDEQTAYDRKIQIQQNYGHSRNTKYP